MTDPDTGKYEAMDGWHYDWMLAAAIGMATKGGGTVYKLPALSVAVPRDIQLMQAAGQYRGGADRI